MKLIIAGSRHLEVTANFIKVSLDNFGLFTTSLFGGNEKDVIKEVISGGATGIDKCGEDFAECFEIPYKIFKAEWNKYGKRAGPLRNKKMAVYGDALLLIWDGESKGSYNMGQEMIALGKPIYEVVLRS